MLNERINTQKDSMVLRKIRTEDGFEFEVDSDALTSGSRFFKALFRYNNNPCITIGGVSSDTMKVIVNYGENKNMVLCENGYLQLLEATDYLMLEEILEDLRPAFPHEISPSNCIDFYHAALNLSHLNFESLCYSYIQIHFELIVKYADIGNLTFEHFKRFLNDKDLNVDSEGTVWEAVVKWIETDPERRIPDFTNLLLCVRLEICTEECIQSITSHPFALKNDTFHKILTRVNPKHKSHLKKRLLEEIKYLSPDSVSLGARTSVVCRVSYFEFLWSDVDIAVTLNEAHSPRYVKVVRKTDFSVDFLFVEDRKIYLFDTEAPEYLYYDLIASSWIRIPPPVVKNQEIHEVAFVIVGSRIFAVWSERELISFDTRVRSRRQKVAFYEQELNRWSAGQSFLDQDNPRLTSFTATVHGGLIYTAGAPSLEHVRWMFGKKYDTAEDAWSEFILPEVQTRNISLVSFKGVLLLFKGETTSVDRFYPEEGVWKSYQHLPVALWAPRAKIRNEVLFIHGLRCDDNSESVTCREGGETGEWGDGSSAIRCPVECIIENADVVRKYHRQLMEDEWQTLMAGWK